MYLHLRDATEGIEVVSLGTYIWKVVEPELGIWDSMCLDFPNSGPSFGLFVKGMNAQSEQAVAQI